MNGSITPAVHSIAWNEMVDALAAERALSSELQQKILNHERLAMNYKAKWKKARKKLRRISNCLRMALMKE